MKVEHKEFKTLGESNAWSKAHGYKWYTNFLGEDGKIIDALKVRSPDEDSSFLFTKIGNTKQAFYK